MLTRNHVFAFFGLLTVAFVLYWAKSEAQAMREKVVVLQDEVEKERRAVRTLEAEIAWLERPDRLEAAGREKLALVPLSPDKITTLADLDRVAPIKTEAAPKPVSSAAKDRP
jgi:hypothetical protein